MQDQKKNKKKQGFEMETNGFWLRQQLLPGFWPIVYGLLFLLSGFCRATWNPNRFSKVPASSSQLNSILNILYKVYWQSNGVSGRLATPLMSLVNFCGNYQKTKRGQMPLINFGQ